MYVCMYGCMICMGTYVFFRCSTGLWAANGLIRAKKWMDRFVIWFCSGGSKNDFSEFCFNHRFEDKTGIPALSAVEVR